MKLGYYTLGTLAMFVGAKLLGLVPDVGWGFILAPAFFHLGGVFVLATIYRQQQHFVVVDEAMATAKAEMKKELENDRRD